MAKKEQATLAVVANEPVELDEAAKEPPTDTKEPPADTKDHKDLEAIPIDDDEPAPPQPPRPVDPITKVTNELKEAFPNVEDKYITAVLIASQGHVDPAFNALLYISDPSFKPEIPAPVSTGPAPVASKKTELTDDELLARQLQKEFELEDERRRRRHERRSRKASQTAPEDESPDEFDQIKETFSQGLEDARTTLNSWVSGLARKLDGAKEEPQSQQNPKLFGALGGSSFNNERRKNNRFDEDPQILTNDFSNKIRLNDDDNKDLPRLPVRRETSPPQHQQQQQNKQQPQPLTGTAAATAPAAATGVTEKKPEAKKWQPLNSDVPANSDAFLVTDSEDEH